MPTESTAPSRPRSLVVMRHAKAQTLAAEDRLRPLTDAGRRAATDVGRWVADRGLRPDAAQVSPAIRTRQTWAAFAEGCGCAVEPTYDAALYSAGVDTVMECLRSVADDPSCLVLVGHNPTVASLVQLLGDGAGDAEALAQISRGFAPSAVATFKVTGEWADLELGTATLTGAYVGLS